MPHANNCEKRRDRCNREKRSTTSKKHILWKTHTPHYLYTKWCVRRAHDSSSSSIVNVNKTTRPGSPRSLSILNAHWRECVLLEWNMRNGCVFNRPTNLHRPAPFAGLCVFRPTRAEWEVFIMANDEWRMWSVWILVFRHQPHRTTKTTSNSRAQQPNGRVRHWHRRQAQRR